MTAINITTDIPVSAQSSLEALAAWCLSALAAIYPDTLSVEGIDASNSPIWVRSISVNPLLTTALSLPPDSPPSKGTYAIAKTPSQNHLVCRFSPILLDAYKGSDGTYWNSITPLGTATIPANFKPPLAS
jgi:hypothetical protein